MENKLLLIFGSVVFVIGVCVGIIISPLMDVRSGIVTLSEAEFVLGNLCMSYGGSVGGVDYVLSGIRSFTVFCKGDVIDRNYTLGNINVSVNV